MTLSNLRLVLALSALAVVTACGSGMLDDARIIAPTGGGGGGNSIGAAASYVGVAGDSLKQGSASITVSGTLTVAGTLTFSGAPVVALTGTVDTVAQELHASGGGYTVSAFTQNGTLSGAYSVNQTSGFLVATSDSVSGQTHQTYCGTYSSTNSNGRFVMQVQSGGGVAGFAIQTTGTAQSSFLNGTVINNSVLTGATQAGAPFNGTVSPDLSTITGTYAPPVANSTSTSTTTATGTFTVSLGGC
jgi:hypothetical protein